LNRQDAKDAKFFKHQKEPGLAGSLRSLGGGAPAHGQRAVLAVCREALQQREFVRA